MATFSVNDTARRVQSIVGSSNRAGPYTFNFQVNATSELLVYQNDTELTLSTQYSATLNSDGTGSITFIDNSGSGGTDYTPAQNDRITIIGDQPLSRTSVFTTGSVITPAALETDFDNVVIRQQQLKEITDRSIQLKPSTARTVTGTGTNGPVFFPELAANKLLSVNNSGDALVMTSEIGSFKGNWSASTSYFQRDIVKDTSTGNIFIANADHTSSGSQPLTTNSDSGKWDLLVDAATATSASQTATAQAAIATTKAGEAATSASNASTSESNALTYKNAAEAAKTAAETAQASAEASLDNFQDQYLGVQANEPSTDLDGDALTEGDIYFNSNSNKLRIFSGGQFKDAAVDTSSFAQAGFAIAMAVAL
jgi:hypothetical protein